MGSWVEKLQGNQDDHENQNDQVSLDKSSELNDITDDDDAHELEDAVDHDALQTSAAADAVVKRKTFGASRTWKKDRTTKRTSKKSEQPRKLYAVCAGFLAVIVALSTVAVLRDSSKVETTAEQSVVPATSSTEADSSIAVIGTCAATTAADSSVSLLDTVVAFEEAYFNRDVENLEATLAEDAAIRSNDWEEITNEAAPEGTTWCGVVMQTSRDDRVSVSLDVTPPDGNPAIFQTVVEGSQVDGVWVIDRFIDPGVPEEDS